VLQQAAWGLHFTLSVVPHLSLLNRFLPKKQEEDKSLLEETRAFQQDAKKRSLKE
jgi:hypothetical protein